jgi:hypothetical protein
MKDVSGVRAAEVASELAAFFRDPASVRLAYLHGERPLPDGQVVLRFALARFASGWQKKLASFDRAQLVEAAQAFVRQVCLRDSASHYQVLCLEPDAKAEAVRENYRLLMALLHPDRQQGAATAWPTGCAQRVNEAYAALSDGAARTAYDRGMHVPHPMPPFEGAAVGVRSAARRRPREVVRPLVVVTGVAMALFMVQSWWVSDVPQHYALLERSAPSSAKWVRDAISGGLPRFLGLSTPSFDPLDVVPPAKPTAQLAAWVPISSPKAERHAIAPIEAPVAAPPAPQMAFAPPAVVAQASAPPPAKAPVAAAAPAALGSSPTTQDIELLVARMVSYYEQGNVDGLMGLFASGEPGFWKGMRVRGSYSEFFRATKQRRLRMNQLNWRTAPESAQARGDATLVAEYADGSGRLDRKVDIEIDIAVRDGKPGITRLTLFPETSR